MTEIPFPFHERLRLENFTVFSDTSLEFVPGINVFLGENGTGKTHAMKALYAWHMARHLADGGKDAKYQTLFEETYGANTLSDLQRAKSRNATVSGKFGEEAWSVGLQNNAAADNGVRPKLRLRPVFIPAIEMMSHARNMNGILRDYADFDRTCFDFLAMITAQNATVLPNDHQGEIGELQKIMPGRVEYNDQEQRFYLIEKNRSLPFQLVADGVRKISAIARLVSLGWIIPGTVLFWDEPEVNLNPKWIESVVRMIVTLAMNHVQVFLATHSYVILKEIDLIVRDQANSGHARVPTQYFSFWKDRGATRTVSSDNFATAEPNAILDQYDRMLAEDWRLHNPRNPAVK